MTSRGIHSRREKLRSQLTRKMGVTLKNSKHIKKWNCNQGGGAYTLANRGLRLMRKWRKGGLKNRPVGIRLEMHCYFGIWGGGRWLTGRKTLAEKKQGLKRGGDYWTYSGINQNPSILDQAQGVTLGGLTG